MNLRGVAAAACEKNLFSKLTWRQSFSARDKLILMKTAANRSQLQPTQDYIIRCERESSHQLKLPTPITSWRCTDNLYSQQSLHHETAKITTTTLKKYNSFLSSPAIITLSSIIVRGCRKEG